MRRPRTSHWPGIPRAHRIDDYVPRDHVQRAESHREFAGEAGSWPVPLTRVGQPASGRHRVLTRRPRGRETILSNVAEAS